TVESRSGRSRRARSASADRAPTDRAAGGTQRHHLPDAHRLSVEPASPDVWRRQLRSPHDAAVGCEGRLRTHLGRTDRQLRRPQWCRLGLAKCRRGNGQSAFWGDHVGPNPTDRGKNGTKRSLIVEADGGPLGVVLAGANVHDTKLLKQPIEAIVVERPEPSEREPQHLCLDKAYDNPTGHAAVGATDYTPH